MLAYMKGLTWGKTGRDLNHISPGQNESRFLFTNLIQRSGALLGGLALVRYAAKRI